MGLLLAIVSAIAAIGKAIVDFVVGLFDAIVRGFVCLGTTSDDWRTRTSFIEVVEWDVSPQVVCREGCDVRVVYDVKGSIKECYGVRLVVEGPGGVSEVVSGYSFHDFLRSPVGVFAPGPGDYLFQLRIKAGGDREQIAREQRVHVLQDFPITEAVSFTAQTIIGAARPGGPANTAGSHQAFSSISFRPHTISFPDKSLTSHQVCDKAIRVIALTYVGQRGSRQPSFTKATILVKRGDGASPEIFSFADVDPGFFTPDFDPPIIISPHLTFGASQTRTELPYEEGEEIVWEFNLLLQCLAPNG